MRPGTRGVTAIDFLRIMAITSHFNLKLTDFILMIRHALGDKPSSQKFSCFSQREGKGSERRIGQVSFSKPCGQRLQRLEGRKRFRICEGMLRGLDSRLEGTGHECNGLAATSPDFSPGMSK